MYPTFLYKCTCPKHAMAKIIAHKVSSVKAFLAYVSHCLGDIGHSTINETYHTCNITGSQWTNKSKKNIPR